MNPSARLVGLLLLVVPVACFAVADPRYAAFAAALDAVVLGLYLFDLRGVRRRRALQVRRELPGFLVRNRPAELTLVVETSGTSSSPRRSRGGGQGGGVSNDLEPVRPLENAPPPPNRPPRSAGEGRRGHANVSITDRLPASCEPREEHWHGRLRGTLARAVVPRRRGRFALIPPAVTVNGPLGLSWTRGQGATTPELHVLPDLAPLGRYDALVRQARLREMGIVRAQLRGEGQEIASLRAYGPGDPFQRVDWKATARRGKPIVREYQAEHQQPLILLLDAGRRMAREANGNSRLDEAVEAALLLGHVALRADDRVGLWAFADAPLRIVAPARGVAHGKVLARAVYDLEPTLREPPYAVIATRVLAAHPRRSLMVLFTDVIEPSSLRQLAGPLRFLGRRHLCLVVIFKDLAVDAALRRPPLSEHQLYVAGAAASLSREREEGIAALRQAGALVLEAEPGGLSTAVVNRYLEIKSRQML